ncbi:MAG: hypothetical protein L0227_09555 [Chloroflexi bacterium]|nr:hypothetical protein [Chloroflexota bacterium]
MLAYPERSHEPMVIVEREETPTDRPGIPPADVARAIDLALADPAVQARLSGHRYEVLVVSTPPEPSGLSKETDPQILPEVIVYDYSTDRWLEIPVDLDRETVAPYTERDPAIDGQPPIVESEAEAALAIALADPEVQAIVDRGYEPIVRPVRVGGIGGAQCVTARCVLVILHSETLNRSAVIQVDLGARLVVGLFEE